MKQINELIRKYDIRPYGYQKIGDTLIINTKDNRIIIKEKNNIYDYLSSRGFKHYPKIF